MWSPGLGACITTVHFSHSSCSDSWGKTLKQCCYTVFYRMLYGKKQQAFIKIQVSMPWSTSTGTIAHWVHVLKNDWDDMKDKQHTRSPVSVADQHHIARPQELLVDKRHWSCHELTRHQAAGLSAAAVEHILHDKLGMRKIAACCVWNPDVRALGGPGMGAYSTWAVGKWRWQTFGGNHCLGWNMGTLVGTGAERTIKQMAAPSFLTSYEIHTGTGTTPGIQSSRH